MRFCAAISTAVQAAVKQMFRNPSKAAPPTPSPLAAMLLRCWVIVDVTCSARSAYRFLMPSTPLSFAVVGRKVAVRT